MSSMPSQFALKKESEHSSSYNLIISTLKSENKELKKKLSIYQGGSQASLSSGGISGSLRQLLPESMNIIEENSQDHDEEGEELDEEHLRFNFQNAQSDMEKLEEERRNQEELYDLEEIQER